MLDVSKYDQFTNKIIRSAIEVHTELGCGFLETVYQKALEKEFVLQNIPALAQSPVDVFYKNEKLSVYVPDFIVWDIIVEVKALEIVNYEQVQMQIINYLVATKKLVGLLLNFGKSKLEIKRYILPRKFQK